MTNPSHYITHMMPLKGKKKVDAKPSFENSTWVPTFLKVWMVGLFLVSASILNAQSTITIDPTFISAAEGVVSSVVNGVHQDKYGLLWIATTNGLQKYDGQKFETFQFDPRNPNSIASNECWSVTSDSDGNIWVGSPIGVERLDRNTGYFKHYNMVLEENVETSSNWAFQIFEDSQNRLWACTREFGIMLFDPQTDQWNQAVVKDGENLIDRSFVLQISEDQYGGIWSGVNPVGLIYAKPGETTFQVMNDQFEIDIDFTDPNQGISSLLADSRGILWFTTRNGVYRYDLETKKLVTIETYDYMALEDWNNWNAIKEDSQGNIWIGNNFRGILLFKNGEETATHVELAGRKRVENKPSEILVTPFTIDRTGIFWFGTRGNGIMKYDPASKPFNIIESIPNEANSLPGNYIFGLAPSKRNDHKAYIGLRGNGLSSYNANKQKFTNTDIVSLDGSNANSVRGLLELDNGHLLIGTWGDGMVEMDENYNEIRRFVFDPLSTGIQSNQVRILKESPDGKVWIGTEGGFSEWDPNANTFLNVASNASRRIDADLTRKVQDLQKSPSGIHLLEAGNGENLKTEFEVSKTTTYLIAMMGEGRDEYLFDYGFITTQDQDTIWSGYEGDKAYYAGGALKNRLRYDAITLEPGGYALHYISDNSHAFANFNETLPDSPEFWGISIIPNPDEKITTDLGIFNEKTSLAYALSNPTIMDIESSEQSIWIGTAWGLNKMDIATRKIEVFLKDEIDDNSLTFNVIKCLEFDDLGMLWIGTENGLDRMDPVSHTFAHYTMTDGLPVNDISSIVRGDEGELWIGTSAGLSRMVRNEKLGKVTFINYHTDDGLKGEDFVAPVGMRTDDGTYYFGHTQGLVTFKAIDASSAPPEIVVSKLMISNQPYSETFTDTTESIALEALTELTLAYDQNDLSFEFTALHYANPSKNQYAHMLKGLEEDWIYDNRNFANYTNLEPGEYVFMMRASNSYGVWNEEGKTIKITILRPWWLTWWAYAGYALLLVLVVFGVDRNIRQRIALREEQKNKDRDLAQAKEIEKAYHKLEEAHEDLKSAQEQLVQQEKLASLGQLTAGIAHEIKNPLNFVNNFSELSIELVDELSESLKNEPLKGKREEVDEYLSDIKANLEKIYQHGTRADGIVKSMLQHSRGGSGKMEPTDLNTLIGEFVNLAFHGMRASKNPINVKLDFDLDENLGQVNLVGEDFSRVVLNIANNAFDAMREKTKTDPEYKAVLTVSSKRSGDGIKISIADNGPGVPEDIKEKILQPFFTTKKGTDGTGLGLSITHDIIKAHGGELAIENEAEAGAAFIIKIPIT